MRDAGKPIGFAGDTFKRKGKWVEISWLQTACKAGAPIAMPAGAMHRCQYVKPPGFHKPGVLEAKTADTTQDTNGKEWWQ